MQHYVFSKTAMGSGQMLVHLRMSDVVAGVVVMQSRPGMPGLDPFKHDPALLFFG
jgi:hypothetical protein